MIITLILFIIVVLFLMVNSIIVKHVPQNSKFGMWWNKHITSFTDMEFTDNEKEKK
jgi:hypothetical protein